MSRVLTNGFSTAASSVASRTTVASSLGGPQASHSIEAVSISGGSSIASTVGIRLLYGMNSTDENSVTLFAGDSSDVNATVSGLGIKASVWEVTLPTTSARGWAVSVLGN